MSTQELKELATEIHDLAKSNGWWDTERTRGEIYALIHSEISEAVEEARLDRPPMYAYSKNGARHLIRWGKFDPQIWEPHGELIELADVVIRCLDWIAKNNIYLDDDTEYEIVSNEAPSFDINSIELYSRFHLALSTLYHDGDGMIWSFIQMVDYACRLRGWDLWEAVQIKHEYNKTRAHRHGGKKF